MLITSEDLYFRIQHQLEAFLRAYEYQWCMARTGEDSVHLVPFDRETLALRMAEAVWKTLAVTIHTAAVHELSLQVGPDFEFDFRRYDEPYVALHSTQTGLNYRPLIVRQDPPNHSPLSHEFVKRELVEVLLGYIPNEKSMLSGDSEELVATKSAKVACTILHDALCHLLVTKGRLNLLGIGIIDLSRDKRTGVFSWVDPTFISYIGLKRRVTPRYQIMVGESLVGDGYEVAHIDLMIGPKAGPVGLAFANRLAEQTAGHNALLAILAPNVPAKPSTVIFNKVTIKGANQAIQMFGPAQAAVAAAVVDSVAEGVIPEADVEDLCLVVGVFIHWDAQDNKKIFEYNYQATKESIKRALAEQPSMSEILAKQDKVKHSFA